MAAKPQRCDLPDAIVALVAEAAGTHAELRQRLTGYLEGMGKNPEGWKLVVTAAHLERD